MEVRATLKDIARIARVSKTTVSLALRNHPKISESTRQLVKATAEQLGYRPDPALASIAANRWRTREHPSDYVVAFITMAHPWTGAEPIGPSRAAATEHGARLGYRVEHFRLQDYPNAETLGRVLFHRGIRGVIIGQLFCDDFLRQFPWHQFANVGCHVGYYTPPCNLVVSDFRNATLHLWREAVARGYRRIGVALLREMDAVDLCDKESAALFAQWRLSPDLPVLPLQNFELYPQAEFKRWMKRAKPDIVIGFNSLVAFWLEQAGYDIPGDVSFAGLDVLSTDRHHGRPISGIDPEYALLGRCAIEQLDLLMRTNQFGLPKRPMTVHVPYEWIEGETMPALHAPDRAPSTALAH